MEVMVHTEFNFDSASNSPYATAPSSPRAFGCYYTSAPTTPSRATAFYDHYHSSAASGSASPVLMPYDWESAPGTPKSEQYESDNEQKVEYHEEDFAFEFSGQLVMGADDALTATADELFEAGKIRPLKPPSRLQNSGVKVLSPRGREQGVRGAEGGGSEREARSLSPLRGPSFESSSKKGSKKWRLKDFFLFRSVSEGRVTSDKDPIRKYTTMSPVSEAMLSRRITEEVKNSSFRSTGSGRSRRGISRERGGSIGATSRRGVSPHEMHYTANRAMSEELKRKTYLPYRQGLLGCLGFSNPALQRLLK